MSELALKKLEKLQRICKLTLLFMMCGVILSKSDPISSAYSIYQLIDIDSLTPALLLLFWSILYSIWRYLPKKKGLLYKKYYVKDDTDSDEARLLNLEIFLSGYKYMLHKCLFQGRILFWIRKWRCFTNHLCILYKIMEELERKLICKSRRQTY